MKIKVSFFITALVATAFFINKAAANSEQAQPAPSAIAEKAPENFCVYNEKSYEAFKKFLPNYFQNLPVYMGADTKVLFVDVVAVVNIGFKGEGIFFKSDVWKYGARYQDELEIKEVCFNTKKRKMDVKFVNKTDLSVKYRDNEFTIDGVDLKKITFEEKQKFNANIINREKEKSGTSGPPGSEVNK